MLRTMRRAVTVAAAAAAVTLAAAGGAGADVGQMESATRVNLQDISDATLAAEQGGDGDGTCANPVVVAAPSTPATQLVVGETYGSDVAEAVAHCMSYQASTAPATLSVTVEYQPYSGAAFVPVPGCPQASTTSPSIAGVHAIASPTVTCQYRYDSAAANRPHRAHAVLTYSGRTYHGYSPVFPDSFATTSPGPAVRTVLAPILDPPVCACGVEEGQ